MSKTFQLATLGLALLFFPGCASTGTDRQDDAVQSLEEMIQEFQALSAQVDKTTAALNAIPAAKDRDMLPPYEFYCGALDDLEDQGDSIVAQAKDVRESLKTYMTGWEKQMQKVNNEEMKEAAAERRAAAEAKFEEAREEFVEIQEHYKGYMADLNDVRRVLANDLNPAGVDSMAGLIEKITGEHADKVKGNIAQIVAALEKISDALNSKSAPPAGAEKKPAGDEGKEESK